METRAGLCARGTPRARSTGAPGAVAALVPLTVAMAVFAVLAVSTASPAAAQLRVKAGAYGLYQSKIFDGTFGFGARAEFELAFLRDGLTLVGFYDHLLPDCAECSLRDIGGQVLLAPQGPLYIGAGASRQTFEGTGGEPAAGAMTDDPPADDWVFSLVAGVRLPVLPVLVPYVEFRQEVGSPQINQQTFAAGILITPSRARAAPRFPGSE